MSLRDSGFDVLDRVIQRALERPVARAYPRADGRARLLRRLAGQRPDYRWLNAVLHEIDGRPARPVHGLELGWRELAFAQALRPSGMFGGLTSLIR